jgi:flagellar hook-length control protein FliK
MLAQSAIHEASSAGRADAAHPGAKAKKKPQSLAGLFSEIMSKVQRDLDPKAHQAPKAESLRKAEGHEREAASRGAANDLKGVEKLGQKAQLLAAPKQRSEGSAKAEAEEARNRRKTDKRHGEPAEDLAGLGGQAPKLANEEKPRRQSKETAADEAMAIRGRRAPVNARQPELPAGGAVAAKARPLRAETDRAAEDRKRDDPRSESRIGVLDLRRSVESRREIAAKASVKAEPKTEEISLKDSVRESKPGSQGRELVRDLTLEPRQSGEAHSFAKADSGSQVASGTDFQSALAERLRDAWNGEIVKSAHIVLRDGDAGTIRLRLKPESLGNVKVELNLSDNNISGRILVESDEAKAAFEKNMNQLADAFRQGGFDSARLEVAVGGGSGNGASGNGQSGNEGGPFYSERLRSAVGSSADPVTAVAAYSRRGGAVDILA